MRTEAIWHHRLAILKMIGPYIRDKENARDNSTGSNYKESKKKKHQAKKYRKRTTISNIENKVSTQRYKRYKSHNQEMSDYCITTKNQTHNPLSTMNANNRITQSEIIKEICFGTEQLTATSTEKGCTTHTEAIPRKQIIIEPEQNW